MNKENTTQVATRKSLGNYGGVIPVENMKQEEVITTMEKAKTIPIKANIELWSPENPNDAMEGLFIGLTTVKLPSLANEGKMEDVKAALFLCAEPVFSTDTGEIVAKQLAKKAIAAKRAVSHFENGLIKDEEGNQEIPPKSMWRVVFKGMTKNKTNTKSSSVFDFYRMNVESNNKEN